MEFTDPNDEIKVLNEKVKEQEKHIELINAECIRWKEEAHESILKYQTLEAQLEQRQNDYRSQLLGKDVKIIDRLFIINNHLVLSKLSSFK